MNYEAITSILNDGLVLATGCTEPGALALTAAAAAAHLGEEVKSTPKNRSSTTAFVCIVGAAPGLM